MEYYKIIINNFIEAVATSNDLRRISAQGLLLISTKERCQFIFVNNKCYHAEWMSPVPQQVEAIFCQILLIDEEEYNLLLETFKKEEVIEAFDQPTIQTTNEIVEQVIIPQYQSYTEQQLLTLIKDRKIKELSQICNQTIESGIDVKMLDGKIHHFSLTTQDQLNLISLQAMMEQGIEQIPYHADGELCKFYTPVEIQMIIAEATRFKTYHTTYYNALKNYVKSLDDPYVIADIQYGIELPEEYQSDVLKTLHD